MAYTVTKYLIGLGHDGIATIGSEKEKAVSNTVREREEGDRAALREAGISHDGMCITVDSRKQRDKETDRYFAGLSSDYGSYHAQQLDRRRVSGMILDRGEKQVFSGSDLSCDLGR